METTVAPPTIEAVRDYWDRRHALAVRWATGYAAEARHTIDRLSSQMRCMLP